MCRDEARHRRLTCKRFDASNGVEAGSSRSFVARGALAADCVAEGTKIDVFAKHVKGRTLLRAGFAFYHLCGHSGVRDDEPAFVDFGLESLPGFEAGFFKPST